MNKYETVAGLMQQLLPLMVELAKEKNIIIDQQDVEIKRLEDEIETLWERIREYEKQSKKNRTKKTK